MPGVVFNGKLVESGQPLTRRSASGVLSGEVAGSYPRRSLTVRAMSGNTSGPSVPPRPSLRTSWWPAVVGRRYTSTRPASGLREPLDAKAGNLPEVFVPRRPDEDPEPEVKHRGGHGQIVGQDQPASAAQHGEEALVSITRLMGFRASDPARRRDRGPWRTWGPAPRRLPKLSRPPGASAGPRPGPERGERSASSSLDDEGVSAEADTAEHVPQLPCKLCR